MCNYLLSQRERNVAVLDHVLDLALHGHEEQHEPVHQQDGPEHWHIKDGEECDHKAYQDGLER